MFVLNLQSDPRIFTRKIPSQIPKSWTAKDNIEDLKAKGVQIKLNFDATKMDVYDIGRFDLVIFMFPHIGNFSTLRFDGKNPISREKLVKFKSLNFPSNCNVCFEFTK